MIADMYLVNSQENISLNAVDILQVFVRLKQKKNMKINHSFTPSIKNATSKCFSSQPNVVRILDTARGDSEHKQM